MRNIKFIHTADLHLGSSLNISANVNDDFFNFFEKAIYTTFTRICDQAIKNNVDFLLISGDIYDQESRSVQANLFFNEQCQRLAERKIPVYLIAGNHDPLSNYSNLLDLPENVHLFSADKAETKKVFDRKGELIAAISGFSYQNRAESRKVHLDYQQITGVWNIGLLHTQLALEDRNYIPSSLEELLDLTDIDYWALGHIHQYRLLHKARNRAILYPGIPQGRDMGELGPGGAVLVELVPDLEPKITFLNLASFIYEQVEISVDKIEKGNITDLENLIIKVGTELLEKNFNFNLENGYTPEGFIIDWVLVGRAELSAVLKEGDAETLFYLTESLREKLMVRRPFIWTKRIVDHTNRPINMDLLNNNPLFQDLEQFLLLFQKDPGLKEELLAELGLIWTDKIDHEDKEYTKFELTEEDFLAILEQARQEIIEELLARRERS